MCLNVVLYIFRAEEELQLQYAIDKEQVSSYTQVSNPEGLNSRRESVH